MSKLAHTLRFAPLVLAAGIVWNAPPVGAQTVGPALPAPAPQRDCEGDPNSPTDVVVCGRRRGESPYRLHRDFRERLEDRETSRVADVRDAVAVERWDGQAVGPGGALRRSRETDCQWRAERQQIRGEQIDCSRSVRPPFAE